MQFARLIAVGLSLALQAAASGPALGLAPVGSSPMPSITIYRPT